MSGNVKKKAELVPDRCSDLCSDFRQDPYRQDQYKTNMDPGLVKYTLIVIFHVLFCLFLWSYWRTVWSHPGKVPQRFR